MCAARNKLTANEPRRFSVDARAMLTWGRESIKDHTTAVLELVKNSYDAGATVTEVPILPDSSNGKVPFIRVADNGSGMTDEQVTHNWLRIGFSEKRDKREIKGRRKSGGKGIGRISADRLGNVLELRTQASTDEPVGLHVDWRWFETSGRELSSVTLQDLADASFLVPQPAKYDRKRN